MRRSAGVLRRRLELIRLDRQRQALHRQGTGWIQVVEARRLLVA